MSSLGTLGKLTGPKAFYFDLRKQALRGLVISYAHLCETAANSNEFQDGLW